jgi:DNA-binding GntR family transcriptional regulator
MKRHRAAADVERYIEANLAFHAILRAHAPNAPLARAIDVVNEMAEPVRHALLTRSVTTSAAAEQHDEIIALLEAGRITEAAERMHQHIFTGMPVALQAVSETALPSRAHPAGSDALPPAPPAPPSRPSPAERSLKAG